jgi:hypothetical protein
MNSKHYKKNLACSWSNAMRTSTDRLVFYEFLQENTLFFKLQNSEWAAT